MAFLLFRLLFKLSNLAPDTHNQVGVKAEAECGVSGMGQEVIGKELPRRSFPMNGPTIQAAYHGQDSFSLDILLGSVLWRVSHKH